MSARGGNKAGKGEWRAPGAESEDFSVSAALGHRPRKVKEELLMLRASCPKLSTAQGLRPRGAG